ncbi:MAG TPA: amidohydrolase family protein [Oscillospiraceae bacterium]|nr:amidohydrolase family protein [Oscillospiraceae bacterium]
MEVINIPAQAALKYAQLWDGFSQNLHNSGTLLINGGVIAEVNSSSHDNYPVWDFSQATILPALIDAHIHLAFPEEDTTPFTTRAQQYLAAGVAAVRDAGSTLSVSTTNTPLLHLQSINAIYQQGSYGSSLGIATANLREALQAVDKLAAAGAAQIKVIASGIFSFSTYGKTGAATFSAAELTEIVNQAASYHLPVMAHASGDEAVRRCLQAGVTTIEHGYFMSRATLQELAASDTCWIPTLSPVNAQLTKPELFTALTPSMHTVILRSLLRHQELIAEGAALGAKIAAGTDAGAPGVLHGTALPEEILLLHNAGLTNFNALQAATSLAAQACQLTQLGSITPGKNPYLLVLSGNPLRDLNVLRTPLALILPAARAWQQ